MGSLIVTSGNTRGELLPLGTRTSVIGRNEALSLQILDQMVSRKHLRIYFDKTSKKYFAMDMKSKHGVFINRCKVTDDVVLADGDEIQIGHTVLLFTDRDFPGIENALSHYKKRGERMRRTYAD